MTNRNVTKKRDQPRRLWSGRPARIVAGVAISHDDVPACRVASLVCVVFYSTTTSASCQSFWWSPECSP